MKPLPNPLWNAPTHTSNDVCSTHQKGDDLITQAPMTPEEFLIYEAQHDDTLFNFVDGEVVAVMATLQRGGIAAAFMSAFSEYVRVNAIGKVYGRVLHVLNGKMYQPDVCIQTSNAQDYFTTAPFVAVEIKTEPLIKTIQRNKALAYIENGVKMAIAVFPGERLDVYRPDREPLVLTYGDVLDGDDVLPGFSVKVDGLL